MNWSLPSVTHGADRHPGPYYVRVGSTQWLAWDGTMTDAPHRSETAAFSDKNEALIAAITAVLQTRQVVSVCVWATGSPPLGVLTGLMIVAWYKPADTEKG